MNRSKIIRYYYQPKIKLKLEYYVNQIYNTTVHARLKMVNRLRLYTVKHQICIVIEKEEEEDKEPYYDVYLESVAIIEKKAKYIHENDIEDVIYIKIKEEGLVSRVNQFLDQDPPLKQIGDKSSGYTPIYFTLSDMSSDDEYLMDVYLYSHEDIEKGRTLDIVEITDKDANEYEEILWALDGLGYDMQKVTLIEIY